MGIFPPNSKKIEIIEKGKNKESYILTGYTIFHIKWWIVSIFRHELTTFRNKNYRFISNV